MASYSGTPLPKKLGISEGDIVAFPDAPREFDRVLRALPSGVRIKRRALGPLDVVVAFFTRRADLERRFAHLAAAIDPHGALWIAWPKRASGVGTDLTEDVVRNVALANGLVDNKVCAIDEVWSGLRLVYRLQDRRASRR
jgi:hypothetical protein